MAYVKKYDDIQIFYFKNLKSKQVQ